MNKIQPYYLIKKQIIKQHSAKEFMKISQFAHEKGGDKQAHNTSMTGRG